MEPAGSALCLEVPSEVWHYLSSCLEVIQQYLRKPGFSAKAAGRTAVCLRKSSASLYQAKWSNFRHRCHDRSIDKCKAIILQIADFFIYLREEEEPNNPCSQGIPSGPYFNLSNHGTEVVEESGNSTSVRILRDAAFQGRLSFQHRTSLLWSRIWLILHMSPRSLSDPQPTLKTCFLLALSFAKRIIELHGLSCKVWMRIERRCCLALSEQSRTEPLSCLEQLFHLCREKEMCDKESHFFLVAWDHWWGI